MSAPNHQPSNEKDTSRDEKTNDAAERVDDYVPCRRRSAHAVQLQKLVHDGNEQERREGKIQIAELARKRKITPTKQAAEDGKLEKVRKLTNRRMQPLVILARGGRHRGAGRNHLRHVLHGVRYGGALRRGRRSAAQGIAENKRQPQEAQSGQQQPCKRTNGVFPLFLSHTLIIREKYSAVNPLRCHNFIFYKIFSSNRIKKGKNFLFFDTPSPL